MLEWASEKVLLTLLKRLQSVPLGHNVNGSPHSALVSLPTMDDVIGYEEGDPAISAQITCGYPRFVKGLNLRQVEAVIAKRLGIAPVEVAAVADENTAVRLRNYLGEAQIHPIGPHFAVQFSEESAAKTKKFLQHTGGALSSRQAEAWLHREGLRSELFSEKRTTDGPQKMLRHLEHWSGVGAENWRLATCGMAAVDAVMQAVNEVQNPRGRDLWVQVGWLYIDTGKLLSDLSAGPAADVILRAADLKDALKAIELAGNRLAGVITEYPTNPALETPNLKALSEACHTQGGIFVVDPSSTGLINTAWPQGADTCPTSITKYAGHYGDVLAGAVGVYPDSQFSDELKRVLSPIPLSEADANRLAWESQTTAEVAQQINANAIQLADFLEQHPATEKLYRPNLERPGALLSLTVRGDFAKFYDHLNLPKTPSFGTSYTITCPYLHLAHYDVVSTREGRELLEKAGMKAELLRISVGTEPIDEIISRFEEAFRELA